jgi:hypothetical protein
MTKGCDSTKTGMRRGSTPSLQPANRLRFGCSLVEADGLGGGSGNGAERAFEIDCFGDALHRLVRVQAGDVVDVIAAFRQRGDRDLRQA